ncbi:hypothetical protein DER44DRAFT_739931 [Fusarium oxysporum]|nr:hypothetical protein DER44DRAFT_739931 [Fusarium oxysporum]
MDHLDATIGQRVQPSGGLTSPPPLPAGKSHNADRAVFRNLVLEGLDDDISCEKVFESYCITSKGVEVTFADDGRAIFGKTFSAPNVRSSVSSEMSQGICRPGQQNKSMPNHFSDVMQFSQDMTDDMKTAYKSAAHALSLSEAWHADIRSLLESQDVPSSSTLAFYRCSPETLKREWATLIESPASTRMTLLGDAAHPMPPAGGVCTNSAFQEAADLCSGLGGLYDASHAGAVKDYVKLLTNRGEQTVTHSAGGTGNMF